MAADTDTAFTGSIPSLYERYLGPLIFEPYAIDLADRVADLAHGELLEMAAGTGIATRALIKTLPDTVKILATDLKRAMLAFAANHTDPGRVTWQQADAQALPCDDGRFDVVACQFGAMFFPDKVGAYREALRVLKPGGRFVFSVWDRIETSEFADVVTKAVADSFPHDPPDFLKRIPHGYHDRGQIGQELEVAGFGGVTIEIVELRSRADSPEEPAIGYCQGTPLRAEIEARDPNQLIPVTETATAAIAAQFGQGPIDGRIQALVTTAIRE
ncbi:MAG: class I SAM-dependent methyltransferase [Acidimicrobiia bacterium]